MRNFFYFRSARAGRKDSAVASSQTAFPEVILVKAEGRLDEKIYFGKFPFTNSFWKFPVSNLFSNVIINF
jgi:hypothetical protein